MGKGGSRGLEYAADSRGSDRGRLALFDRYGPTGLGLVMGLPYLAKLGLAQNYVVVPFHMILIRNGGKYRGEVEVEDFLVESGKLAREKGSTRAL